MLDATQASTCGEVVAVSQSAHAGGVSTLCWIPASDHRPDSPFLHKPGETAPEPPCLDAGGTLVSGGYDGAIRRWSRLLEPLEARVGRFLPLSAAGSHCGKLVAMGGADGAVSVHPSHGLDHTEGLREGHGAGVCCVAFAPSRERCGMMVSGDLEGGWILWAESGEALATLSNEAGSPLRSVSWSPDARSCLAVWEDGKVTLVPAPGLGGHAGGLPHDRDVTAMAASSSWRSTGNRSIASGGVDGRVCLWDAASGVRMKGPANEGESKGVWSVAVDATGTTLFTGSDDGAVRQWDVTTGRLAWEHGGKADAGGGHEKRVACLSLSPFTCCLKQEPRPNVKTVICSVCDAVDDSASTSRTSLSCR